MVWNTFVKEFSEGRQSGERINLGLSFASFGQAKEDESNMPVNSHYGFVFTKTSHTEAQISRAIAHELGHVPIAIGTFHLWHTFSNENKYVASQGTTTNLMDYNGTATDLYKYQWDYVHNPEFVLFRGDDEESEAIVENVIVERVNVKPQNLYNKKYLRFVKMGRMKENDPTQSLFFKMEDGSVIREYSVTNQYYETDEAERKFEIVLPNTTEPIPFYLDKHKDYLLSDEISFIGKEVSRIAGTTVARYVLPIEDIYIIFEGEDLDGEEASRLAAGGFLLIEFVPGSKLLKPITKVVKVGANAVTSSTRKVFKYINGKKTVVGELIDDTFKPGKWIEGEFDEVVETWENIKYINNEGKELSGTIQVVRQGEKVGAKSIKASFKIGDEIAGISIKQIKEGSNGKIAIIGRSMGN